MPLILKDFAVAAAYQNFGPSVYSGVLTNLGVITIPAELENYIERFSFIAPPPDPSLRHNCAVAIYNDKLVLTFGNQTESSLLEKQFINFLRKEGLSIKILNPK